MTKERLDSLIIKEDLTKQKKKLFIKIFYNREKILIQEFRKIGKVRLEVVSLQKIRIVLYNAWYVRFFLIPRALR